MKEIKEPLCTECVYYPEPKADAETSAPDRPAGGVLAQEFLCPRIRRRVAPTYAPRCPEFEEAVPETDER
jgi:hypothetical protein